ncbi:MAG: hypothetical protein HY708_03245 [Ignavibacteriae bacterium]|nr:hypothetical protein [Ignavibacteriota bacterium]
MKRFTLLVATLVFAIVAFAQDTKTDDKKPAKAAAKTVSMKGYVVDAMCAKGIAKKNNVMERAAKHTKECALEEACAASGYGLFYDNGTWVKFDEAGDKEAMALVQNTKMEKEIMVDVTGKMEGDILVLASIKEARMETKVKGAKEETHDHK